MEESKQPSWTFLTNHALVLLCIAKDNQARIRDLAVSTNVTERAVQRIIVELEAEGYLRHMRAGRRNVYEIIGDMPLRPAALGGVKVQKLLELVAEPVARRSRG